MARTHSSKWGTLQRVLLIDDWRSLSDKPGIEGENDTATAWVTLFAAQVHALFLAGFSEEEALKVVGDISRAVKEDLGRLVYFLNEYSGDHRAALRKEARSRKGIVVNERTEPQDLTAPFSVRETVTLFVTFQSIQDAMTVRLRVIFPNLRKPDALHQDEAAIPLPPPTAEGKEQMDSVMLANM